MKKKVLAFLNKNRLWMTKKVMTFLNKNRLWMKFLNIYKTGLWEIISLFAIHGMIFLFFRQSNTMETSIGLVAITMSIHWIFLKIDLLFNLFNQGLKITESLVKFEQDKLQEEGAFNEFNELIKDKELKNRVMFVKVVKIGEGKNKIKFPILINLN